MDRDHTQLLVNIQKKRENLTYNTTAKEIVGIQKINYETKISRIIKGYMSLDKNKTLILHACKHICNAITQYTLLSQLLKLLTCIKLSRFIRHWNAVQHILSLF